MLLRTGLPKGAGRTDIHFQDTATGLFQPGHKNMTTRFGLGCLFKPELSPQNVDQNQYVNAKNQHSPSFRHGFSRNDEGFDFRYKFVGIPQYSNTNKPLQFINNLFYFIRIELRQSFWLHAAD